MRIRGPCHRRRRNCTSDGTVWTVWIVWTVWTAVRNCIELSAERGISMHSYFGYVLCVMLVMLCVMRCVLYI